MCYQTTVRDKCNVTSDHQAHYLDILVVLPEVHKTMVGLDGLGKVPNVNTDSDEVLPDLPVFIVTLQSFLQGTESFVSATNRTKREFTVIFIAVLGV